MLRVLSRSCCVLCLYVGVQLSSEIRRQVASRLQEPAVTSLPLSHRANAIRASRVIHKPGTSKPFISAKGHTIVIATWDKILVHGLDFVHFPNVAPYVCTVCFWFVRLTGGV